MKLGWLRIVYVASALAAFRFVAPWWCERGADAWYRGDATVQGQLAEDLVTFERDDDTIREGNEPPENRFAGEWALVTHQMTALGLAQVVALHPERKAAYVPVITRASIKTFLPEMRDFGTKAWHGEDAMKSLEGSHGHAYLAYSALALGVARSLDPSFPADVAKQHDALIAAYEKRLLASPTGLIETYPNEAYPTDVAAVAAAIAVHGRATGARHERVLAHWADKVRTTQLDRDSGFVIQRMGAHDAKAHDLPRGSGTGLAAYFAGFADRSVARRLAEGLFRHTTGIWEFGAVEEYVDGPVEPGQITRGFGDVDSGPVLFGVSVAATGFTLAPARAFGQKDVFVRLFRTTALFGIPYTSGTRGRFLTGGPIGNALLLAMLTSGPELSP
ncbi:hypothetical protein [Pendulispora albinea]|uniref:Linalool dehydratase/isomerase domain-containing protein n=1 Tax=Pendulispora albinea TaxID=2741071 RepID=A0ABZ2M076_9BACT